MKKLKKIVIISGLIGLGIVGFINAQQAGNGTADISGLSNRLDTDPTELFQRQLMREQASREAMDKDIQRLRQLKELQDIMISLGFVNGYGIFIGADGKYHLSVPNNQPVEIVVPDNVEVVIRKNSEVTAQR
jgi:hypothetical protein